jgi:hypothetical protein
MLPYIQTLCVSAQENIGYHSHCFVKGTFKISSGYFELHNTILLIERRNLSFYLISALEKTSFQFYYGILILKTRNYQRSSPISQLG